MYTYIYIYIIWIDYLMYPSVVVNYLMCGKPIVSLIKQSTNSLVFHIYVSLPRRIYGLV